MCSGYDLLHPNEHTDSYDWLHYSLASSAEIVSYYKKANCHQHWTAKS